MKRSRVLLPFAKCMKQLGYNHKHNQETLNEDDRLGSVCTTVSRHSRKGVLPLLRQP